MLSGITVGLNPIEESCDDLGVKLSAGARMYANQKPSARQPAKVIKPCANDVFAFLLRHYPTTKSL